jgi:folate-binding protein YgfZ
MSGLFWCADPRDLLLVEGPDALTYLQSQLSQDLRPLAVGQSMYSLVLQPAGKVDALLRVLRTGDESFVLDTDPGAGEVLLARLNRFKIRVKADITPLEWTCIALRGEGAMDVEVGDDVWKASAWRGDGTAVDLLGPNVPAPDGVRAGTPVELLAARVDAGWPAASLDFDPGEAIPAALGVTVEAVSFTKGCYPGQELVERMDSRGAQAPRSLHVVEVPAGTVTGDQVSVDGTDVEVRSVAGTKALAYTRRA